MLYLIGIGLKPEHLTLEALEAVRKCRKVYLESYTSAFAQGNKEGLEKVLGKKVEELDRQKVEEGFGKKFEEAKQENIALLVYGAPLIATTHVQLLLDAKKKGVGFKVIEGLSILNFLAETGLDAYKFGRVATIVKPRQGFEPESFFDIVERNYRNGMHTLCLLDIDAEKQELMSVGEGLGVLEKIAKKREWERKAEGREVSEPQVLIGGKPAGRGKGFFGKAELVGIAGAGSDKSIVKVGKLDEMKSFPPEPKPQSLVVCSVLSEKEKEALKELNR